MINDDYFFIILFLYVNVVCVNANPQALFFEKNFKN